MAFLVKKTKKYAPSSIMNFAEAPKLAYFHFQYQGSLKNRYFKLNCNHATHCPDRKDKAKTYGNYAKRLLNDEFTVT